MTVAGDLLGFAGKILGAPLKLSMNVGAAIGAKINDGFPFDASDVLAIEKISGGRWRITTRMLKGWLNPVLVWGDWDSDDGIGYTYFDGRGLPFKRGDVINMEKIGGVVTTTYRKDGETWTYTLK